MVLSGKKLAVSFPDTVLEEKESPRDKTVKLGLIARACSIYGVDVIEVFRDERKRGEGNFIRRVLEYLETPQYLRKRLFPIDESLRYAGLLPPLRIPSHRPRVPVEKLNVGDVREGVTNPDGTVDIGLERSPHLVGRERANRRVTVRIASKTPLTAELMPRDRVGEYWGYTVESKEAGEVFSDQRFGLGIATSRFGNGLKAIAPRLRDSVRDAAGVKLVFGSPSRGLFDIVGPELSRKASFVIDLFPEQNVETVRTEEAILVALNLVSVLTI
ncbi:MAG: RNA methyltransferase [Thaumarchaeota archaeon]|nr:RNA methyltransferase [Nitrososphaerota archaeon]